MTVLEDIKAQLLVARREKLDMKKKAFSTLLSEVVMLGKNEGNRETTDAEAIQVIEKFAKGVKETITLLEAKKYLDTHAGNIMTAKNTSVIAELKEELELYLNFLPQQLTEDELKAKIVTFLETNKPNMGALMGYLKNNFKGRYDGRMANQLFKSITDA